ncbi:hypothetical protein BDW66DRAFT_154773 [Aspergillus desertorum]
MAQVERRLDELTSLVQEGLGHSLSSQTATSRIELPLTRGSAARRTPGSSQASPQHLVYSPHNPSTAMDAADEEILNDFRSNRLPYLPFMYIPHACPAAEVKVKYPFFWPLLVALHCKDMVRQAVLREELEAAAAKALMADCQRSMDLLFGVILYLAWMGCERQPCRMSLGPYVQMLIGLVLDMGLNLPFPQAACQILCRRRLVQAAAVTREDGGGTTSGSWMLVVCSAVSHTLGHTESLRWTGPMRECMDMLSEATETPSDAVLVQMMRAQIVVDRVTKDFGDNEGAGDYHEICEQMPSDEIQKSEASPTLTGNVCSPISPSRRNNSVRGGLEVGPNKYNDMDLTRLSHLYACLGAVRNRFAVLVSHSVADIALHPSTIIFPVFHSLLTLLGLSTSEYTGWYLLAVRQAADLLSITDQVADKLAHVADAVGFRNPAAGSDEAGCFTMTSRVLLGLRARWAARLPDVRAGNKKNKRRNQVMVSCEKHSAVFTDPGSAVSAGLWLA